MRVTVRINGTSENRWAKMGLRANPFPQIARAEFEGADAILRRLDSEPIVSVADLRARLEGCSAEFVDLCAARYVPGALVEFDVSFPEPS